jgi:hypothetical protein
MNSLFAFLLSIACINHVAFSQENGLFRYIERGAVSLNSKQAQQYERIESRATTSGIYLVRIESPPQMQRRQTLVLNLPDRGIFDAPVRKIGKKGENQFDWVGSGRDHEELIVLTVNKHNVNGLIHLKDGLFLLEPLDGGLHVLSLVDQKKFPPDDPPQPLAGLRERSSELDSDLGPLMRGSGGAFSQTNAVIDVLVVYTAAAASSVADVGNLINNAIAVTIEVHYNSFVSASVAAVHTAQVNYTETGSLETDVERLQGSSDGYMDNVHTLRDQHGADVVILLVEHGDYAGLAFNIHVDESGAFAVVLTEAAVANYTFAHELGHLVGGRHDDDQQSLPRADAHGYAKRSGNPTFKTVMAVFEGAPRIPYWSNPDVDYESSPTGTANWNYVARV